MGLSLAKLWLAYKKEKGSSWVQNWMKNILLRPDILRNESIIVIQFSYDKVLIACVKTIENSGWSQTLSTWYVKKRDFDLHRVFNTLYVCAEWAQLKKKNADFRIWKMINENKSSYYREIEAYKQEVYSPYNQLPTI